jgi:hypothetical protein
LHPNKADIAAISTGVAQLVFWNPVLTVRAGPIFAVRDMSPKVLLWNPSSVAPMTFVKGTGFQVLTVNSSVGKSRTFIAHFETALSFVRLDYGLSNPHSSTAGAALKIAFFVMCSHLNFEDFFPLASGTRSICTVCNVNFKRLLIRGSKIASPTGPARASSKVSIVCGLWRIFGSILGNEQ